MADTTDDVLSHYGIKGMRWGVRRKRDSDTGRVKGTPAPAPKPSQDAKAANKLKKKSATELSNAELKDLNRRLQLELDYARLMNDPANKSKVQKGEDFVKKALSYGQMATQVYNLATHPMTKKVISQVRRLN